MIETHITQNTTAGPIPGHFLALVDQANEALKDVVAKSKLSYRAIWSVQGGAEPRVELTLSCFGGNKTMMFQAPQLRENGERLHWTLQKHVWAVLQAATEIAAKDMRHHLAAIDWDVLQTAIEIAAKDVRHHLAAIDLRDE